MSGAILKGEAARPHGLVRRAPTAAIAAAAPRVEVAAPVPAAPAAPAPVETVRGQAEATLRESAAEAAKLAEQAREQARREGFETGRREAQAQVAEAIERQEQAWQATSRALEAGVRDALGQLESLAVRIGYEACARLLGDAAARPEAVAVVVRRLVDDVVSDTGVIHARLHPVDLDAVRRALGGEGADTGRALRWHADAGLARGDCRIDTPHGSLESGLAIQLDAIRDALVAAHAARMQERSAT